MKKEATWGAAEPRVVTTPVGLSKKALICRSACRQRGWQRLKVWGQRQQAAGRQGVGMAAVRS